MSANSKSGVFLLAVLLPAVPLMEGASCGSAIGSDAAGRAAESLDRVTAALQAAIATLAGESSAWQSTLTNLEEKIAADA